MTVQRRGSRLDGTRRTHPAVNRAVLALLRSRLHRLADGKLCELRYQAPASGRTVHLPVMYTPHNGAYVILVGDAAGKRWWRAFRTPHAVDVCAGSTVARGIGVVLEPDDPRFADAVAAYQRHQHVKATSGDRVMLIAFSSGAAG